MLISGFMVDFNNTSNVKDKFVLFVFLFFVILNPYTVYGQIGTYATLLSLFLGVLLLDFKFPFIKRFVLLLSISLFGVFISHINNIGQFNHLLVVISLVCVFFTGVIIANFSIRKKVRKIEFLSIVNNVIFFNCLIVFLQLMYPSFRGVVESFLVEAGNRDWSEGFRYRGVASSGGAALSLLSSVSILITTYLFKFKYYNGFRFIVYLSIVFFSTMVIGRTGLLISGVVFVIYSFYVFMSGRASTLLSIIFFVLVLAISMFVLFPYLEEVMTDQYGEGFLHYSFGFMLEGRSGFQNEGTISVLFGFLSVLPVDFPFIFTGYGFFGGSDFVPWTDSGLARTFLSVGIPLGFLFYFIIFSIFYQCISGERHKLLYLLIASCLFIGELKESMLYTGYSARAFIFILSFVYVYNKYFRACDNEVN